MRRVIRYVTSGYRLTKSRLYSGMFAASKRIFPLVLSPFERLMLLEDRPQHPMTFTIQIRFVGEMQRAPFTIALKDALARHPMLQAHVGAVKAERLCWVHEPERAMSVEWCGVGPPIDPPPIDIRREGGLKMWMWVGEGHTCWTLQFHHACCDGIGAYRFCGDVLCGYARLMAGCSQGLELAKLEPGLLRGRISRMRFGDEGKPVSRGALSAIRYAWKMLGRSVAPVSAGGSKPDGTLALPDMGILSESLSEEEFRQLRAAASDYGGSYNDLLITELISTIQRWNESEGGEQRKPIRILIPVDLRRAGDERMPSANMASYTFIQRRPRECGDSQQLSRSVVEESLRIRQLGAGTEFIEALTWGWDIPGLLPLLFGGSRCLMSAVYSNPGDPSKRFMTRFPRHAGAVVCGDLMIEEFRGCPPLRCGTHVALATSSYRRRLTVCLRCDPACFDGVAARRFLHCYVSGLRRSISRQRAPAAADRAAGVQL